MRGGYFMIDCTGLDLTKGIEEQTISGIHAECKKAMNLNKPVYAVNCKWGSDGLVTPVEVMLIDFGDYIIATASTLQIIVQKTDVITIYNLVS